MPPAAARTARTTTAAVNDKDDGIDSADDTSASADNDDTGAAERARAKAAAGGDDSAHMSSGGPLSPTALLLLRSEQPLHFLQPAAGATATRKASGDNSQPHGHRTGEAASEQDARPPMRTEEAELAATTAVTYDIDSESRAERNSGVVQAKADEGKEEEAPPPPPPPMTAVGGGSFFFRRSDSFSGDGDAAARTFPPGRSESMSALAATASSQLRTGSSGGGGSVAAAGLRISSAQADDLAMKAILSPPHLRASSSTGKLADAKAVSGGRSALTMLEATSTNLFEQGAKLLFRGVSGVSGGNNNSSTSSSASAVPAATAKASDASTIKNKQSSSGSIVEEDLAKLNNNVLVSHPTLPPPPFANMFACDNCREDIGTLLSKGRHHCRNCGGSFCADCTTKSVIVPFQVYLTRGEQRVCDGCYHRIKDFQSQAQSTQVTWSGLQPPPSDVFTAEFELPESEVPVTIYNCSLFMDFSPFYGHLFLTREHACFKGYKGHKIKIPYAKIVSLIKPQFYYINALQVKTRRKEKFFFAEFNGLRDLCFLRMDQLIRAYQEGKKHFVQVSPDDLVQQAMVRRKSYKLLVESAASGSAPKSSSFMSSSKRFEADNFLSGKSTVGYIDIDEEGEEEEEESGGEGDDDSNSSRSRRTSRSVMDEDGEDKKSSSSDEEMFEPLPPDAVLAKTTVLLDCELKADVRDVFDLLWNDGIGQDFLFGSMEKARDIDIVVGKWEAITSTNEDAVNKGFVVSKEGGFTLHRAVQSQHPPRITFPGLPAYAVCNRVQRFRLDSTSPDGERWDRFIISDILRMARIPFSDYFEIETRWVFSRDGKNYCHVQAGLIVNFIKSTWFKSQIDSSTRTESKEVLESWAKEAIEHLIAHKNLQREGGRGGELACSPAVRAATAPSCSSADTSVSEVGSVRDEDTSREPKSPRAKIRSRQSRSQKPAAVAGDHGTSSAIAAGDGGVVTSLQQLIEARSSPVVQLLVVLVLLYCLMLIRFQQNQLQQLTTTTNVLLERFLRQQQEQQMSASRLSPPTGGAGEVDNLLQICQQRLVEGASEALRQFFEDASTQSRR